MMVVKGGLKGLYLERFGRKDARNLSSALTTVGSSEFLTPSKVDTALEMHKKTGIPLRMVFELELKKGLIQASNVLAMKLAKNLHSSYRTNSGKVRIIPSFAVRTRPNEATEKSRQRYGLHNFTMVAFRVVPDPVQARKFSHTKLGLFQGNSVSYGYVQIFEVGFGLINKKPVILVTNAQALKWFYSLPQSAKRMFKGSYEKVLEIVQTANGGGRTPVLIPSNETVRGMLKSIFGHAPSDKVLDEFYDKFSEKRGKRKVSLTIKNPVGGKSFTGDFWV